MDPTCEASTACDCAWKGTIPEGEKRKGMDEKKKPKKPPVYEPPKLIKFDRLEKLIQGGE